MSGLPRVPSTVRRRLVWEVMILGALERLTDWLMSGNEVSDADLQDLIGLRQRLRAFDAALTARERAAGVVLEDAE
jgi:hypothetical protein